MTMFRSVWVECDGFVEGDPEMPCGNQVPPDHGAETWQEARGEARDRGWKLGRRKDYCDACREQAGRAR